MKKYIRIAFWILLSGFIIILIGFFLNKKEISDQKQTLSENHFYVDIFHELENSGGNTAIERDGQKYSLASDLADEDRIICEVRKTLFSSFTRKIKVYMTNPSQVDYSVCEDIKGMIKSGEEEIIPQRALDIKAGEAAVVTTSVIPPGVKKTLFLSYDAFAVGEGEHKIIYMYSADGQYYLDYFSYDF